MSMPAASAAAASSSDITRSMVSCPLPLRARRSAIVGLMRVISASSGAGPGNVQGVELFAVWLRRGGQFLAIVIFWVDLLLAQ